MTVLESSWQADSKTVPELWIWWLTQYLTSLQLFTDSLEMELCLQPWINQSMLHQIQRSGTVLESACYKDSETVINF